MCPQGVDEHGLGKILGQEHSSWLRFAHFLHHAFDRPPQDRPVVCDSQMNRRRKKAQQPRSLTASYSKAGPS
jgi:hypothetical protein